MNETSQISEKRGKSILLAQRQKEIKDYLVNKGFASVEELGEMFEVSSMTIRCDLDELQRQGLLQHIYGGAMDNEKVFFEISFQDKTVQFAKEKERNGRALAELILHGDTVFIDSGTTTFQITRFLKDKKITTITNSLDIALELSSSPLVNIHMTGGILHKGPLNVFGSQTENFINQIRADKLLSV